MPDAVKRVGGGLSRKWGFSQDYIWEGLNRGHVVHREILDVVVGPAGSVCGSAVLVPPECLCDQQPSIQILNVMRTARSPESRKAASILFLCLQYRYRQIENLAVYNAKYILYALFQTFCIIQ